MSKFNQGTSGFGVPDRSADQVVLRFCRVCCCIMDIYIRGVKEL
ncbi:hypothetical protein ASZ90_017976 [hydrocarbon metagenome]|uniref:Uncharacterized protein n=1 Tax=hydrocarbon metagenome TaxID=938273 RepID=A0A0W8E7J6_9ZZZZ